MRIFIFLLFFLLSSFVWSAETLTCTPLKLKIQNKTILLPDVEKDRPSQVYVVHNISPNSLWLDHPTERKGMSAGWSSYIQPNKWSAIVLNRKDFAISCAVIQPGKVDEEECAKAVKVCHAENMTVTSKRKGSYWLVEDKTWNELTQALFQPHLKN